MTGESAEAPQLQGGNRSWAWIVLWLATLGGLAGSLVALRQQAELATQASARADQAERALAAAQRANRLLRQRFDESRSSVSFP